VAQPYKKLIEAAMTVFFSGLLLLLCNYWLTSAVVAILACGQAISTHYIFKRRLTPTMNYYTVIEYESRKKIMSLLINNLRGRDVIQSFEKTSEFCRE
jgi:predicted Co/Zn/Cd cation transporter (cation efflux family)